jgi:hypothetical protein
MYRMNQKKVQLTPSSSSFQIYKKGASTVMWGTSSSPLSEMQKRQINIAFWYCHIRSDPPSNVGQDAYMAPSEGHDVYWIMNSLYESGIVIQNRNKFIDSQL